MTNIAILSPRIIDKDAVGNDVAWMHQVLTKHGYKAQIFASDWSISKPKIQSVTQVKQFLRNKADLLIYHYSVGWDIGMKILKELKCRKVIRYHNITPPEFYKGINTDYVSACQLGREQLKSIIETDCDLYLAASEYNAEELYFKGVERENISVLSPFHNIDYLQSIDADLGILDKYKDGKVNILMVGRIAPNKGHLALINTFNIYNKYYNRESRLLIVGRQDERLKIYSQLLHEKVRALNLQDSVVFAGEVSAEALKSYYLVSSVFMTASEHEGFCVPLVESMAMKLPIVAYGSSAIPQTVGKTGLVWEQPDAHLLAGSVDYLVKNEFISARLGEMGWRRYKEVFTNEHIEAKFMEILKSLV